MSSPASVHGFAGELRRRKVWQVAAIYVVVAAPVIGFANDTLPRLLLPDWTVTFVIVLTILGFPIAIALAWTYDITRGGIERKRTLEIAQSAEPPDPQDVSAETSSELSIVVLPFANLSPDSDQDYFCDGMTEEIITDLSRLRALRVISRTSAMLLKGSAKDVKAIGHALGVRYVLEGSVRRADGRLRITAQLIDSLTDAHLWAERYDGEVSDVFAIQEKVARSIADALRVELTHQDAAALAEAAVADVTAYECVLRARHAIWTGTEASGRAAIQYLEEAQEIVGENVAVLSALGEAHFMLPHTTGEGLDDLPTKMEKIADRILRLDPDSAMGHFNKALAYGKRPWSIADAVRELRRASELAPADASIRVFHAFYAAEVGCTEEAIQVSDELVAVDPLSPLAHLSRGFVLMLAGRSEAGAQEAERVFTMDSDSAYFRLFLMLPLIQAGRRNEAMRLASEMPRPAVDNWAQFVLLYQAVLAPHPSDDPITRGLTETGRIDETFSWMLAECLTQLNRTDEALDWLENAISFGFTNTTFLGERDVLLGPLRGLPRFQALMARASQIARSVSVEKPAAQRPNWLSQTREIRGREGTHRGQGRQNRSDTGSV